MISDRLLRRLGHFRAFSWFGRRVYFPVERWLWARTGSRPPLHRIPVLLLTTTGRTSGQRRTVPVNYLRDGDRLVLVASNWGESQHPGWSQNLLANPAAEVQLDGRPEPRRARLATDSERAELWPKLLEIWPAWRTYTTRTTREFRIFILEPLT